MKHWECRKIIKKWASGYYESYAVKCWVKKMGACQKCIDKIKWLKGGEND